MSKITVMCVDDSALMRQLMTEIINSHPDMEMVATAPDPLVARDLIKQYDPQVLTLDVEMPRMGRPRLSGKADAPAPDAGGNGLFPDRKRLGGDATCRWSWGRSISSPSHSWAFAKG
jgi:hypothetical protein